MKLGEKRGTHYRVECWRDGRLVWWDEFDNLVVTAGLNDSLSQHFKGSLYTALWYVGLTAGAPVFAAADTMAAHAGWTEATGYTQPSRPVLVLGAVAAGSVDNSASQATFTVSANATLGGAFLNTSNVKGGAMGTLYGGGAFASGDQAVIIGDTVLVTLTLTAAAA